jgi:hypothetical protein
MVPDGLAQAALVPSPSCGLADLAVVCEVSRSKIGFGR